MKKYILDVWNKSRDSGWTEVHDNKEEANKHAEAEWDSLTKKEKEVTEVYVTDVAEEDLRPDAFDEDGNVVEWEFHNKITPEEEGLFNSKRIKELEVE